MRRRLVLIPFAGVAVLAVCVPAAAAPPTTPPPTPTSTPTSSTTTTSTTVPGATTTTLAGTPVPTSTIAPVPAPARSGSAIGGLEKGSANELWSVRQMAIAIAAAVAGLAVVGYVYGRVRSSFS